MNNWIKGIGALLLVVVVSYTVSTVSVPVENQNGDGPVAGAVASPDINSAYIRYGAGYGVRTWATGTGLTQATTTICAILSPAATSTLVSGGVKIDLASSSATTVYIAKATTAYATTTLLGAAIAVGAGAQGFGVASTTGSHVFAPNTYFVVGLTGGDSGVANPVGLVPRGSCHAVFEEYLSL